MSNNQERHERIIKALVNKIDADNGHESDTARAILKKLCKKYKLNLDEVLNKKTQRVERAYSYQGKNQDVLAQIIWRYGGNEELKQNKYRKVLFTDLTDAEHLEVTHAISVLMPQFKRELKKLQKIALNAFVQKHDLFYKGERKDSGKKIGDGKKKTAAEIEREMREAAQIMAMAEGMDDMPLLKQLGHG